jgi:hypothetical protein
MDLLDDGLRRRLTGWLEYHLLENFEPLVLELSDGLHLHVVPIEILKEEAHPLDHNLMVGPSFVQSSQKLLARLSFEISLDVGLKVVLDRLRILRVQYLLGLIVLDSAEIIHDSKITTKI